MSDEKLPILLTGPRPEDFKKNISGGDKKPLCQFTQEIRNNFVSQLSFIKSDYEVKAKKYPNVPCVGKVIMKEKAIAKSHKPNDILTTNTCPIIGTGKLNEIYIKVTENGINEMIKDISITETKAKKIQMTKIEKFEVYDEKDSLKLELKNLNKPLKIKLFDYLNEGDNRETERCFLELIKDLGLDKDIEKVTAYKTMKIYKLNCKDVTKVKELASFQGIKSIDFFPMYSSSNPKLNKKQKMLLDIPKPIDGIEYPIIGLIDSGVSESNEYIKPWIYKREEYVEKIYQDNSHGTFVSGVLLFGERLNMGKIENPNFKILDVIALPNSNPNLGPTDSLREDIFLQIMDEVLEKYSDKVKIWNLSLGTDLECDEIISDLGVELDKLQDEYNVKFFIAAGNYEDKAREWPVENNHNDRVTIPADSVRSITVGSIALEKGNGIVNANEPSPFSRRGPGANNIQKPEIVGYGGNCNLYGDYNGCGIVSFDIDGNLIEGIGTSYSTPFITAKYQDIVNALNNEHKYEIGEALLIHSCKNPINNNYKMENNEVKYLGFGLPKTDINDILKCDKNNVTLILQGKIPSGQHIEIENMPYPKSLYKDGKWLGEILVTLLYNPPLDEKEGQEYCRTNIDFKMGLHTLDKKTGKLEFHGKVPMEVKWDEKFEKQRVENGFKWSPIKRHYRNIKNGIEGTDWKVRLDCTSRNNIQIEEQEFIVIITIMTADENADIYTEMYNELRERGFIINNLQLQNEIQIRS